MKHTKKVLMIPVITVTSLGLLLSGCSSEPAPEKKKNEDTVQIDESKIDKETGLVKPEDMGITEYETVDRGVAKYNSDFTAFLRPFSTLNEGSWMGYKEMGSTKVHDDAKIRTITYEEYVALAQNGEITDLQKASKVLGDITSDVEESALRVSEMLEKNPSMTVEALDATEGLVINRHPQLLNMQIVQDENTNFFFVVAKAITEEETAIMGMVVPQKDITPEEFMPPMSEEDLIPELRR